jgi:putative spermidine/putrescine transport system ATP-binding protein/spermidine/putrescine transport system ATP-binding protein
MAEVILDRVTKRFAEVLAVDDASLVAESERFLTLLGPSGCGKTTALRMIAGFERPDAGDIRIGATSVLSVPAERRNVGMVFQNYALFPHMNVSRNISYGLRFQRDVDPLRRVRELLDLVGLSGFERRRSTELSAGQQQRVALARALAPRPQVLLLDEPLSALDASLRETLRFEIRRIQQELALTMVYVTHDQEEALGLSDRIAVMNAGRIEQVGSPHEIYTAPRTGFVASFVGRANRIEGAVIDRRGGVMRVDVGPAILDVVECGDSDVCAGDRVAIFIKAEHLRPAPPGVGAIESEIAGVEYRGAETLVYVLSGVGRLRFFIPSDAASGLSVGERISLEVPAETAVAFPVIV